MGGGEVEEVVVVEVALVIKGVQRSVAKETGDGAAETTVHI
jgi:hypothetical protein